VLIVRQENAPAAAEGSMVKALEIPS